MHIIVFLILIFASNGVSLANSNQSSVLSNGNWYKISTNKDGIYKITSKHLIDLGINVNNLKNSHIKIYGNGGGMLPMLNSQKRKIDLIENAIKIVDLNQNGFFDSQDFILFYGESPNKWIFNTNSSLFNYEQNLYSDKTFYFLTIDENSSGKRIEDFSSTLQENNIVNTYNDFISHELEEENLISTGRKWFGERFDIISNYSYNFFFPNLDFSSEITLTTSVAARSFNTSNFIVSSNGQQIQQISVPKVFDTYATEYAKISTKSNIFSSNNKNINIDISYIPSVSNSIGWLDYFEINARSNLKMHDSQMLFRDINSLGDNNISKFIIEFNSSISVWEITESHNIRNIMLDLNSNNAEFTIKTDSLKEFIAFEGNNFLSPVLEGDVINQNLRALSSEISYLIISHPLFLDEAYRLAELHKERDSLNYTIVTPEQIYNEFSSGSQDISAIRDFIKFLYDKENSSLKYVLLFGDASYDYKERIANNSNFIPIYQSQNSTHPTLTYATDDFYVLLDENEGLFENDLVDLGIGRLPANNVEQAKIFVDKIFKYYSNESFGDWRNRITFVADDGDLSDGNTHMWQADSLANIIDNDQNNINLEKIYLDDFEQVSTPGGPRSPSAQRAINNSINKGSFLVNFTGHGGILGWTQERILELSQINDWNNEYMMPLFMTATCKFSLFDDPEKISAGEYVLLNPNGGAIALLSTTRLVYSSPNYNLNKKFIKTLFEKDDGKFSKLGDIFKRTKEQSGTSINNRNFTLLGDPALSLNFPKHKIITTSVSVDTLKALSEVTISGDLENEEGIKLNDFDGILYVTVFDKEVISVTLGQQSSTPMPYRSQKNIIYKGKASVQNGSFSFSFVVPKDISYSYGNGRISYYAVSENNLYTDASGYDQEIIIGGNAENIVFDYDQPVLEMYMNNENFVSGGITDENPLLLANVFDFSGINTVGNGIGHDIVAILDGEKNNPIILNDFYETNIDDFRSGIIRFRFQDLKPGQHTLTLKVWDVFNNSAESEINFIVREKLNFVLENFECYPNPFSDKIDFYFQHNRPDDNFNLDFKIYSITGQVIKSFSKEIFSNGFRYGPITWDGRDDNGMFVSNGIYLVNINISTKQGELLRKSIRIIRTQE